MGATPQVGGASGGERSSRGMSERDPDKTGYRPEGAHVRFVQRQDRRLAVLEQPVAFFIPEHVPDPSRRGLGEELWVEVTLPRKGPPDRYGSE